MSGTILCENYGKYCNNSGLFLGGKEDYKGGAISLSEELVNGISSSFSKFNKSIASLTKSANVTNQELAQAVNKLSRELKQSVITRMEGGKYTDAINIAKIFIGGAAEDSNFINENYYAEFQGGDEIFGHSEFMIDSIEFVTGAAEEASKTLSANIAAFKAYLELLKKTLEASKSSDDKATLRRTINEQYEFVKGAITEFGRLANRVGADSKTYRELEELSRKGKIDEIKKLLKAKDINKELIEGYATLVKSQGSTVVLAADLEAALKAISMKKSEFERLNSLSEVDEAIRKYENQIFAKNGKDKLKYIKALDKVKKFANMKVAGQDVFTGADETAEDVSNVEIEEIEYTGGKSIHAEYLGLEREVELELTAEATGKFYDPIKRNFIEAQAKYIAKIIAAAHDAALNIEKLNMYDSEEIRVFVMRLEGIRQLDDDQAVEIFANREKNFYSNSQKEVYIGSLRELITASKAVEKLVPDIRGFISAIESYIKFLEDTYASMKESVGRGENVNCSYITNESVYERFIGGARSVSMNEAIGQFKKLVFIGKMKYGMNVSLQDLDNFSAEQDEINKNILSKDLNTIQALIDNMIDKYENHPNFPIKKELFSSVIQNNFAGITYLKHAVQALDKKMRLYQAAIVKNPTAAKELVDLLQKVVIDTNWMDDKFDYSKKFTDYFHVESVGNGLKDIVVEAGNDYCKAAGKSPFTQTNAGVLASHVSTLVTCVGEKIRTRDAAPANGFTAEGRNNDLNSFNIKEMKKNFADENKISDIKPAINYYYGSALLPFVNSSDIDAADASITNATNSGKDVNHVNSIRFLSDRIIEKHYREAMLAAENSAKEFGTIRNLFSIFENIDKAYVKATGDKDNKVKIGQIYNSVKEYLKLTSIYPIVYKLDNGNYCCGYLAMREFGKDVIVPFEQSESTKVSDIMTNIFHFNLRDYFSNKIVNNDVDGCIKNRQNYANSIGAVQIRADNTGSVAFTNAIGGGTPLMTAEFNDLTPAQQAEIRRLNNLVEAAEEAHRREARVNIPDDPLVDPVPPVPGVLLPALPNQNEPGGRYFDINRHYSQYKANPDNPMPRYDLDLSGFSKLYETKQLTKVYGDSDLIFVMMLKSMFVKILGTLEFLNVVNGVEGLLKYNQFRSMYGGVEGEILYPVTAQVRPECTELYVRLFNLAKFYKELFMQETNPSDMELLQFGAFKRMALLPTNNSKFGKILELIFIKYFKDVTFDNFQSVDLSTFVTLCNQIYDAYSGTEKVRTEKILQDFIHDINSRYGLVKTDQIIDLMTHKEGKLNPAVKKLSYEDRKNLESKKADIFTREKLLDGEDELIGDLGAPSAAKEHGLRNNLFKESSLIIPKPDKYDIPNLMACVYNFRRYLDNKTKNFEKDASKISNLTFMINVTKNKIRDNNNNIDRLRILHDYMFGKSNTQVHIVSDKTLLYRDLVINSMNLLFKIYLRLMAEIQLYGTHGQFQNPINRGSFLYYLSSINTDLVQTTSIGSVPRLDFSNLRNVLQQFLDQTKSYHSNMKYDVKSAFVENVDKRLVDLTNIHNSLFATGGIISSIDYDNDVDGIKLMLHNDFSQFTHFNVFNGGDIVFSENPNNLCFPNGMKVKDPRIKYALPGRVAVPDLTFDTLCNDFSPRNIYQLFEYLLVSIYDNFFINGVWYEPLMQPFVDAAADTYPAIDVLDINNELGGAEIFDNELPFSKKALAVYKALFNFTNAKGIKIVEPDLTKIPEETKSKLQKYLPIYIFLFKFIIHHAFLQSKILEAQNSVVNNRNEFSSFDIPGVPGDYTGRFNFKITGRGEFDNINSTSRAQIVEILKKNEKQMKKLSEYDFTNINRTVKAINSEFGEDIISISNVGDNTRLIESVNETYRKLLKNISDREFQDLFDKFYYDLDKLNSYIQKIRVSFNDREMIGSALTTNILLAEYEDKIAKNKKTIEQLSSAMKRATGTNKQILSNKITNLSVENASMSESLKTSNSGITRYPIISFKTGGNPANFDYGTKRFYDDAAPPAALAVVNIDTITLKITQGEVISPKDKLIYGKTKIIAFIGDKKNKDITQFQYFTCELFMHNGFDDVSITHNRKILNMFRVIVKLLPLANNSDITEDEIKNTCVRLMKEKYLDNNIFDMLNYFPLSDDKKFEDSVHNTTGANARAPGYEYGNNIISNIKANTMNTFTENSNLYITNLSSNDVNVKNSIAADLLYIQNYKLNNMPGPVGNFEHPLINLVEEIKSILIVNGAPLAIPDITTGVIDATPNALQAANSNNFLNINNNKLLNNNLVITGYYNNDNTLFSLPAANNPRTADQEQLLSNSFYIGWLFCGLDEKFSSANNKKINYPNDNFKQTLDVNTINRIKEKINSLSNWINRSTLIFYLGYGLNHDKAELEVIMNAQITRDVATVIRGLARGAARGAVIKGKAVANQGRVCKAVKYSNDVVYSSGYNHIKIISELVEEFQKANTDFIKQRYFYRILYSILSLGNFIKYEFQEFDLLVIAKEAINANTDLTNPNNYTNNIIKDAVNLLTPYESDINSLINIIIDKIFGPAPIYINKKIKFDDLYNNDGVNITSSKYGSNLIDVIGYIQCSNLDRNDLKFNYPKFKVILDKLNPGDSIQILSNKNSLTLYDCSYLSGKTTMLYSALKTPTLDAKLNIATQINMKLTALSILLSFEELITGYAAHALAFENHANQTAAGFIAVIRANAGGVNGAGNAAGNPVVDLDVIVSTKIDAIMLAVAYTGLNNYKKLEYLNDKYKSEFTGLMKIINGLSPEKLLFYSYLLYGFDGLNTKKPFLCNLQLSKTPIDDTMYNLNMISGYSDISTAKYFIDNIADYNKIINLEDYDVNRNVNNISEFRNFLAHVEGGAANIATGGAGVATNVTFDFHDKYNTLQTIMLFATYFMNYQLYKSISSEQQLAPHREAIEQLLLKDVNTNKKLRELVKHKNEINNFYNTLQLLGTSINKYSAESDNKHLKVKRINDAHNITSNNMNVAADTDLEFVDINNLFDFDTKRYVGGAITQLPAQPLDAGITKDNAIMKAKNTIKFATTIYKNLAKIHSELGVKPKYLSNDPILTDVYSILNIKEDTKPLCIGTDAIPTFVNTINGAKSQNIISDYNQIKDRKALGLHCNNIRDLNEMFRNGKDGLLNGLMLFLHSDNMHIITANDFPNVKKLASNVTTFDKHMLNFGKLSKYAYELEFKGMFANTFPVFNNVKYPKFSSRILLPGGDHRTINMHNKQVSELDRASFDLLVNFPNLSLLGNGGNDNCRFINEMCNHDIFNEKYVIEPAELVPIIELNTNNKKFSDYLTIDNSISDYSSIGNPNDTIQNIIDIGIFPVNVNSIMREIPLANIMNASYVFDELIKNSKESYVYKYLMDDKVYLANPFNKINVYIKNPNDTHSRLYNTIANGVNNFDDITQPVINGNFTDSKSSRQFFKTSLINGGDPCLFKLYKKDYLFPASNVQKLALGNTRVLQSGDKEIYNVERKPDFSTYIEKSLSGDIEITAVNYITGTYLENQSMGVTRTETNTLPGVDSKLNSTIINGNIYAQNLFFAYNKIYKDKFVSNTHSTYKKSTLSEGVISLWNNTN